MKRSILAALAIIIGVALAWAAPPVQANELTVWVSAGTFGSEINGTQYDCAYGAGNSTNVFYVGWDTWNSKCVVGLMDETVWMNGKAVNATEAQSIYEGTWRP